MLSMQAFYTQLISRPPRPTPYHVILIRLCLLSRSQLVALRLAKRWEIWG
jgi:hypothetical protein